MPAVGTRGCISYVESCGLQLTPHADHVVFSAGIACQWDCSFSLEIARKSHKFKGKYPLSI